MAKQQDPSNPTKEFKSHYNWAPAQSKNVWIERMTDATDTSASILSDYPRSSILPPGKIDAATENSIMAKKRRPSSAHYNSVCKCVFKCVFGAYAYVRTHVDHWPPPRLREQLQLRLQRLSFHQWHHQSQLRQTWIFRQPDTKKRLQEVKVLPLKLSSYSRTDDSTHEALYYHEISRAPCKEALKACWGFPINNNNNMTPPPPQKKKQPEKRSQITHTWIWACWLRSSICSHTHKKRVYKISGEHCAKQGEYCLLCWAHAGSTLKWQM